MKKQLQFSEKIEALFQYNENYLPNNVCLKIQTFIKIQNRSWC